MALVISLSRREKEQKPLGIFLLGRSVPQAVLAGTPSSVNLGTEAQGADMLMETLQPYY